VSQLEQVHPELAADTILFLEALRTGSGPINAGLAVGWSPEKTRKIMRMPGMPELIDDAKESKTETIEQRVYEQAEKGNQRAMELYLFCQASDRGWRPPTQRVQIGGGTTMKIEVVEASRQSVLAILERSGGVKALQPGGPLDEDIIDADVIDAD
jgi:hypothetical protein